MLRRRASADHRAMAVGRRLAALRARHGLSMNKIHLETRMSTSYLAKLERDEFVPQPKNLDRIIAALEVLDVDDAESLRSEYEAVRRERQLLDEIAGALREVDQADDRLRLLERLLGELDELRTTTD